MFCEFAPLYNVMPRIALKLEGEESMKRSLLMKFLVLTLTLLVGSLAVTATERPFSLNGTGYRGSNP